VGSVDQPAWLQQRRRRCGGCRLRALRKSGHWPAIPLGINLGKSKITPIENAVDDYLYSFRLLAPLADYVVLNVSSPNTPGLRSLQEHDALEQLLAAIRHENETVGKPVLLKIAPDLSMWNSNRSSRPANITPSPESLPRTRPWITLRFPLARDQTGGLSGVPLREKIDRIRSRHHFPLLVAGHRLGWNLRRRQRAGKLEAGAQLLQVYTATSIAVRVYCARSRKDCRRLSASPTWRSGRR